MENMGYNDNLTICKYCGNMIAKEAKICPHCGGKNKKPIYKRVWFWLIIFIIMLFMALPLILGFLTAYLDDVNGYELSDDAYYMSESEYMSSCKSVEYDDLARNPNSYYGQKVKFTGEVQYVEYDENQGYAEYTIAVTRVVDGLEGIYTYTTYEDEIFASYYYFENDKLLEEDIVTIYCEVTGEVINDKPCVEIVYVDFQ